MKKPKISRDYFPRQHFWKFWEKKKVSDVLIETDTAVTVRNFYEDGTLKREYIRCNNGDEQEKTYFANGQIRTEISVKNDETRCVRWDENGNMLVDNRVNDKSQIETLFHPNGRLKIKHNRQTGHYEEWTDTGILKKKGLWVNKYGGLAESLGDFDSRFETGNMHQKYKDEQRQEYNEVIDSINELPSTVGRKIAKEALAKAFQENRRNIRQRD